MEDMELSLPLPEDPYLWISIFQHLRWKDLLGSVSLVCKFWHALSKDDLLRSHIAHREGRLRWVGSLGVVKPELRLMQPKIRCMTVWKDHLTIGYCTSTIKVLDIQKLQEDREAEKPLLPALPEELVEIPVVASVTVPPLDGEGNLETLAVWFPREGVRDSLLVSVSNRGHGRIWQWDGERGSPINCIAKMHCKLSVWVFNSERLFKPGPEPTDREYYAEWRDKIDGQAHLVPSLGPCVAVVSWRHCLCVVGSEGVTVWEDDRPHKLTWKGQDITGCLGAITVGERWLCCRQMVNVLVFDATKGLEATCRLVAFRPLVVIQGMGSQRLMTIEEENWMKMWDLTDGSLLSHGQDSSAQVHAVTSWNRFLYTGHENGVINMWN